MRASDDRRIPETVRCLSVMFKSRSVSGMNQLRISSVFAPSGFRLALPAALRLVKWDFSFFALIEHGLCCRF
jgi:hypothetical protein